MTMTTHAREIVVSLLNFCIVILNVNVVEAPQAKDVFGTVSTILALVRVSNPFLHPPMNV